MTTHDDQSKRFLQEAAEAPRSGLVVEIKDLLRENKKWWLGPILLVLFLAGLLATGGSQAAAPFIYTLF